MSEFSPEELDKIGMIRPTRYCECIKQVFTATPCESCDKLRVSCNSQSDALEQKDARIQLYEKALRKIAITEYHDYAMPNTWEHIEIAETALETAGGSEPGSIKQRLDMLDQFEEAERISEHVSSLTETVPDQGKDDG